MCLSPKVSGVYLYSEFFFLKYQDNTYSLKYTEMAQLITRKDKKEQSNEVYQTDSK